MATVDFETGLYSFTVRGTLGLPNGLGRAKCGWTKCGYRSEADGIFQKRHSGRRAIFVKERHYRTANPRTEAQQAWRAVFAAGMAAWGNLTGEEKQSYNVRAKQKPGWCGWNVFLREYLKARAN